MRRTTVVSGLDPGLLNPSRIEEIDENSIPNSVTLLQPLMSPTSEYELD